MFGNNIQSETILIRSMSATNGMTTILVGTAVASLGALIILLLPQLFFLLGIFFLSGSIVAFIMGYSKLREPKVSLSITKQSITYYHRRGTWNIPWENIQRIDVPRIQKGLQYIDLEMIGFRLRDPEPFIQTISLRLITHLLTEQRPLVTQVAISDCKSGNCYGDDIIEDVKYKLRDGRQITGVTAMFANRMRKLQQGLGYDIYLSTNDLDRDAPAFITLLRECQQSVLATNKSL